MSIHPPLACTSQVWRALDGAAICLNIFTADGLSPLLVQEDVLNRCLDLLRFHIAHNVLIKKPVAVVEGTVLVFVASRRSGFDRRNCPDWCVAAP